LVGRMRINRQAEIGQKQPVDGAIANE